MGRDILLMTTKGQLTGMAGVYMVAAELTQQGFIASPTSRSARGADILVADQNCKHACSLQVKTNGKNASFWLLNPHAKDMVSPTHLYVLVNIIKDRSEFFIVPSRVVARRMDIAKQGKGMWYSISRENVKEFKDKWDLLGEPGKL
jgi:hypothetical protein